MPPQTAGDMVEIWFGAEFFVDEMLSAMDPSSPGIWWQEPITFSSSRSGLTRQLKLHYEHRLRTPEAHMMSLEEMRQNLRLAVYRVEIPTHLVDLNTPTRAGEQGQDSSYTWNSNFAFSQLKQVYNWVLRTLHVAGLCQQLREVWDAPEFGREAERRANLIQALGKISEPIGKLTGMDLFAPDAKRRVSQPDRESTPEKQLALVI